MEYWWRPAGSGFKSLLKMTHQFACMCEVDRGAYVNPSPVYRKIAYGPSLGERTFDEVCRIGAFVAA